MIVEAVDVELAVVCLREFARAESGAASIHNNCDETEFGKCGRRRGLGWAGNSHTESSRHDGGEGTGIFEIDDRILLAGVEIARLVQQAPEVGASVRGLGYELLRRFVSRRK